METVWPCLLRCLQWVLLGWVCLMGYACGIRCIGSVTSEIRGVSSRRTTTPCESACN
ncbi:hypothetical protein BJ508DRAFT_412257 [Ascobolus immersus RN42]|uniref:Uncharacterized protein n=1 Tax=Ascobolus immersus RN42 TaxID=1160509 RepID=A0A3N4IH15_ASCIM|nr:hypothetical protein BJ508DRAFT_412257 [Ascobolus immersus RN42]